STRAGLAYLPDAGIVVVHDAARPLLDDALIDRIIAASRKVGAAIPVVPVSDTLHRTTPDGRSAGVVDRETLAAAQTPQAARRDWLVDALDRAGQATDEGGMLQAAGYPVALVAGDARNLKITWPLDLTIARSILAAERADVWGGVPRGDRTGGPLRPRGRAARRDRRNPRRRRDGGHRRPLPARRR
ncbi:MAG TPA: 2-C-methyl-D-erythritol 4-phosphate cytidylyltransferase, partial [Thermomicrobiales bacterium]|nr:2-C-methyl-D-erythritol 4-phosphate cytidylyltransferase [Thermomicrobiales bacterium]